MKYFLIFFAFIYLTEKSVAQTNSEKKFIRFAIGKEHVLYSTKTPRISIQDIKEAVNADTLFDWVHNPMLKINKWPDSLMLLLTASEKAFINIELDKMKNITWKSKLLKHSLAVDFEKLKVYKKEHDGKLYYNPDDYEDGAYEFTKPIFIRNNTICLFYVVHHFGGKFLVYVKDRGKWELRITPVLWVS